MTNDELKRLAENVQETLKESGVKGEDILDSMAQKLKESLPDEMENLFGPDFSNMVLDALDTDMGEYGSNYVTLTDDDGNEVEFEHIDTVEYKGTTYLAFIPADLPVDADAEVVIMRIIEENGEELLEAVDDDETADEVFGIVMERAEAEYEE